METLLHNNRKKKSLSILFCKTTSQLQAFRPSTSPCNSYIFTIAETTKGQVDISSKKNKKNVDGIIRKMGDH